LQNGQEQLFAEKYQTTPWMRMLRLQDAATEVFWLLSGITLAAHPIRLTSTLIRYLMALTRREYGFREGRRWSHGVVVAIGR